MGFKKTSTHVAVPTHLKWIVANPGKVGNEFEIVTILMNEEWKTITFFSHDFKFNLKCSTDQEYTVTNDDLYKAFKRGSVKAILKDETNLEERKYTCSIDIEPLSPEKGGRKYKFGTYRISIEPSSQEE